jgi:hypothetical protein
VLGLFRRRKAEREPSPSRYRLVSTLLRALLFGLGLGLGVAVIAGAVVLGLREDDKRRAQEQAATIATKTEEDRRAQVTATARRAAIFATAYTQAQAEGTARVMQATAVAEATQAAKRCADPRAIAVKGVLRWEDAVPGRLFHAFYSGVAQNTCNYALNATLELAALSSNGTVLATKSVYLSPLRPGEEQSFSQFVAQRTARDVASVRAEPKVTECGYC